MKLTASVALLLLSFLAPATSSLRAAGLPPGVEKLSDGIVLSQGDHAFLKVEVCADDIIRVASAPDRAFFTHASLMLDPHRPPATVAWELLTDEKFVTLRTAQVQARVTLATGEVSFLD